jgi:hypothetical protein
MHNPRPFVIGRHILAPGLLLSSESCGGAVRDQGGFRKRNAGIRQIDKHIWRLQSRRDDNDILQANECQLLDQPARVRPVSAVSRPRSKMGHTCPVFGYPSLTESARSPRSGRGSYEICPSCGFQFGVTDDDLGYTYEEWRTKWIAEGASWSSDNPSPAE